MLPEASQARKAIWDAINPHTGKRRIDEAFPPEIRETTRENEMLIRLKCGSTWQVVGSDNYNSLVGSPPVGVVFSEYSIANPAAWAYIRPILRENGGWALFIYTPRGRNHGAQLYQAAKQTEGWFSQILTAPETGVFTAAELAAEQAEYKREYGDDQGQAFFEQEYLCSFDSAIMGAIYGAQIRKLEQLGRITKVAWDPNLPVNTAWDLGFDDSTALWFYQLAVGEIRLIDYYENAGQAPDHYCEQLIGFKLKRNARNEIQTNEHGKAIWTTEPLEGAEHRQRYSYARHWVPHDAAHELLAAGGRSIVNQCWDMGIEMSVIPATSQQNSINAARKTLVRCYFDEVRCEKGLNALRNYQFEWDDEKRTFKSKPRHDWSSHGSDAFEIIGQTWQEPVELKPAEPPRWLDQARADELFDLEGKFKVNHFERERF
jgi:hypothetical protein